MNQCTIHKYLKLNKVLAFLPNKYRSHAIATECQLKGVSMYTASKSKLDSALKSTYMYINLSTIEKSQISLNLRIDRTGAGVVSPFPL